MPLVHCLADCSSECWLSTTDCSWLTTQGGVGSITLILVKEVFTCTCDIHVEDTNGGAGGNNRKQPMKNAPY